MAARVAVLVASPHTIKNPRDWLSGKILTQGECIWLLVYIKAHTCRIQLHPNGLLINIARCAINIFMEMDLVVGKHALETRHMVLEDLPYYTYSPAMPSGQIISPDRHLERKSGYWINGTWKKIFFAELGYSIRHLPLEWWLMLKSRAIMTSPQVATGVRTLDEVFSIRCEWTKPLNPTRYNVHMHIYLSGLIKYLVDHQMGCPQLCWQFSIWRTMLLILASSLRNHGLYGGVNKDITELLSEPSLNQSKYHCFVL